MPPPSSIVDYLTALDRELAFDPALSRRVRHEVADHLWQAAEAEAVKSQRDAEYRAVSRFGEPQAIAAQYRAVWLHTRMRRTGLGILCAVLLAFAAMESRVYWYGLTQWQIGDRLREIGAAIVPIDRYAFLAAIVCGIIGSIYVVSRPIPPTHRPASRNQLRCGQYLIGAAAGATAIAVTTEIILTAWRLSETSWTTNSLLPLATIIGEAGIVSAAILYLRNTVLRTAAVLDQAVRPGTTQ